LIGVFALALLVTCLDISSKVEGFVNGMLGVMIIISYFWMLIESDVKYYANPVVSLAGSIFYGLALLVLIP